MKYEPKFKVGDHVVILEDDVFPKIAGLTGTVLDVSTSPYISLDDPDKYPRRSFKLVGRISVRQDDIELSEIVFSPLWKALL